jgi:glycosidase
VLLDYGEELGLAATSNDPHPLMQWSPTNDLPKPKPPPEPVTVITPPLPDDAPKYGSFKEFVPPLPRNLLPPPKMPEVFESDNPQPRILDPDAQPGFTDGTLDTALSAPNGATANVAMENLDPTSLLNFTRRLIRLHHDNAILHTGMESLTDRDAENILQWTRHSPTGNIVVLCNLGSNAIALDTTTLHAKSMRTLVTSGTTKDGIVPAETVVVVETH